MCITKVTTTLSKKEYKQQKKILKALKIKEYEQAMFDAASPLTESTDNLFKRLDELNLSDIANQWSYLKMRGSPEEYNAFMLKNAIAIDQIRSIAHMEIKQKDPNWKHVQKRIKPIIGSFPENHPLKMNKDPLDNPEKFLDDLIEQLEKLQ